MAGPPLINNRTESVVAAGKARKRTVKGERRAKGRRKRGLFSLPRSPTLPLSPCLFLSCQYRREREVAEVGRWLGELGMDFMPRAKYMAAAMPGQK